MSFSGNLATQPPLYWAGKQGGREAANLLDTMENCRLIGTIDLEFEVIENKSKHKTPNVQDKDRNQNGY